MSNWNTFQVEQYQRHLVNQTGLMGLGNLSVQDQIAIQEAGAAVKFHHASEGLSDKRKKVTNFSRKGSLTQRQKNDRKVADEDTWSWVTEILWVGERISLMATLIWTWASNSIWNGAPLQTQKRNEPAGPNQLDTAKLRSGSLWNRCQIGRWSTSVDARHKAWRHGPRQKESDLSAFHFQFRDVCQANFGRWTGQQSARLGLYKNAMFIYSPTLGLKIFLKLDMFEPWKHQGAPHGEKMPRDHSELHRHTHLESLRCLWLLLPRDDRPLEPRNGKQLHLMFPQKFFNLFQDIDKTILLASSGNL